MGAAVLPFLAIASVGVQVAGGIQAAQAQAQQGRNNKDYYYELADINEEQADEQRGVAERQVAYNTKVANSNITSLNANASRDTMTIERASRQVSGAQTAAGAASGVEAGSATAEDIARDTFDKASLDKMAIRYNTDNKIGNIALTSNINSWETMNQADLNARNLRRQAKAYRRAGDLGVSAGNINANTTLLTTAGTALSSAYSYAKGI